MYLTTEQYKILSDLTVKLHPHLGIENHTLLLINRAMNNLPMNARDYFDLGKYYECMLNIMDNNDGGQLSATLALKNLIYSL